MQFKWEPKEIFDDEGNDLGECFTGHIVVDVKPKIERLKLANKMQLDVKGGEVEIDAIGKLEKMDEVLKSAVVKVDLKTKDGQEIKTLDDLECFQEGILIGQHLIGIAINGMKLGKPSKPSSAQP